MSVPPTSVPTPNVISSAALEDGLVRYSSRLGPLIAQYGLEAVLANLSPRQAAAAGLLTNATSGRTGAGSSASAALQSFLVSKCRELLTGSDLCEVIWKPWTTPWGASLSRPRARVRTSLEIGSGLWQTMVSDDAMERKGGKRNSRGEPKLSAQALWPTARANDGTGTKVPPARQGGAALKTVAMWAAAARDWRSDRSQKTSEEMYGTKGRPLSRQVIEASTWVGPTAMDGRRGSLPPRPWDKGVPLSQQVALYPSASASGFEAKDPVRLLERRAKCKERTGNGNGFGLTLGQFALLNTNGSLEQMEKPGALNPEFVCWLMQFPPEWLSCAPSATR